MKSTSISLAPLLRETRAGLEQRPSRTVLTALGSVIGVMSLVVVLGLTESAGAQIGKQFDLIQATTVRVVTIDDQLKVATAPFPEDVEARVDAINGVVSCGVTWKINVNASSRPWLREDSSAAVEVRAGTPGLFDEVGARFTSGESYGAPSDKMAARVAILGAGAANELGITQGPGDNATVYIDGLPFTVVGVVGNLDRQADLLRAVVIPASTAVKLWGQPSHSSAPTLSIKVRTGAAEVVGAQVANALDVLQPDRFVVETPPDPRDLREGVQKQMQWLFMALAAVCLVVGMVGIANTTYVAVLERRGEIGLRRAMGARPADILAQFLIESASLGLLGGIVGTSLGLVVVVGTCLVMNWTAVVPVAIILIGPAIGLGSGSVAGFYPALQASRIEPIAALRGLG